MFIIMIIVYTFTNVIITIIDIIIYPVFLHLFTESKTRFLSNIFSSHHFLCNNIYELNLVSNKYLID